MRLRRLLALKLTLLVLVSQLYMPVHTHVCHGMGKSWSALWVKPDSCCKNKNSKSVENHIHHEHPEQVDLQWKQLPCCENHSSCLKMAGQYVKSVSKSVSKSVVKTPEPERIVFSSPLILLPSYLRFDHVLSNRLQNPPPIRSGPETLCWYQVWQC